MTQKAVVDAVYARLAANWTLSPVIAENTSGVVPLDGSAFIGVDFPLARSFAATLGREFREEGTIRFAIFTEIGFGRDKAYTHAEALAALFRLIKIDGVEYRAPTIRQGVNDPVYFKLIVSVPYFYNYAG